MLFVLPAVLFWGLFALAVWFFFFRATVRKERAVANAKKRSAEFDALLTKPGEPLHCLYCGHSFYGPLGDEGCPNCHTGAFVIPAQASSDPAVRNAPLPPQQTVAEPAPENEYDADEAETPPLQRNQSV